MRLKIAILAAVLLLVAVPALAQETGNVVSFNGFSFTFDTVLASNVNIMQSAGSQDTFPPEPPHTRFFVYNGTTVPQGLFDQGIVVTLYRTADFAGYSDAESAFQQLQTLLAQRPNLASYMTVAEDGSGQPLPFLPSIPAGQAIRARAQYVETPVVRGVSYVTVYRQDVSPFTGGEFVYTFQGLSQDGAYYVSAILNMDTTVFPAELPAFDPNTFDAPQYFNESIQQLNQAGTEAFTPSLSSLDVLVQSFGLALTGIPLPATEVPADTNTDPTLGGLAGTWTLVSYGPADAPQTVLPTAPATLTFATTGIAGSSGCNTFAGSFDYNAGVVTFRDVASTLMACDPAIMDQELALLTALNTASTFQVSADQLLINYDGGTLIFVKAA